MSERIFVAVAWPYANGPLHLGHVAGCYLSADIFARYHRMKGNEVLMVSGSDTHGTPITIRADQEGITPEQVVDRYHAMFIDSWDKLGISFDLFTSTETANHAKVVHDVFDALYEKGFIYTDNMLLAYCSRCDRYLPDRYVEGTCPNCNNGRARGDQCDACGRTLDPQDLVEPHCSICGTTPEFRESEHFFLKLSAFEKPLLEWVEKQVHWRSNVKNFTRQFLRDGLKDRAISRDLSWGVHLPVDGYEGKRIYVWFEAVIGYLSAAVQWADENGTNWEDFWKDPETKSYYFIGKDNIPFHSIIWPAIIMAYDQGLNLPYDVPANEFLSLENQKFSTSQNWAVWVPDYLDKYDPDPLRYLLSINMPESGDSDFSWSEFVRRNNEELVATYGNLVNRVLSFTFRNFDGKVPGVESMDEVDERLLRTASETMDSVSDNLYNCKFKVAVTQAFGLAQEANRYLDTKAPWKSIKEDRELAGSSLTVAMQTINCLKAILYPFMPFSSQKVHEFLGFDGPVEQCSWDFAAAVGQIKAGANLRQPSPLYTKLDPELIDEEIHKLGIGISGE